MIYPILETESVVRVGDKTRLDGSKSFGDDLTKYEIESKAGAGFVECDQFLDLIYDESGEKEVTLKVTDSLGDSKTISKKILVVTESEDDLYSSDFDLKDIESNIMRYLPESRSSYLDKHRAAKKLILSELRKSKVIANGQEDLEGVALDFDALKLWSVYLTLSLIFGSENTGYGVGGDSYFKDKALYYRTLAQTVSNEVVLGKDTNSDNVPDEALPSIFSCEMVRS